MCAITKLQTRRLLPKVPPQNYTPWKQLIESTHLQRRRATALCPRFCQPPQRVARLLSRAPRRRDCTVGARALLIRGCDRLCQIILKGLLVCGLQSVYK